jgi:hypothetical protein
MSMVRGTGVGDAALATLRCSASLRELRVDRCANVTAAASFAHLPALFKLCCACTGVGDAALATLPSSLRELDVSGCAHVTAAASFAHLPALLILRCWHAGVGDASVATLPPSLRVLVVSYCSHVTAAVSFRHLPALSELHCSGTSPTGLDLVRFDCPATSGSPMAVRVMIGATTSIDIYEIKFDVVFDPAVVNFDGPAVEGDFLNQDGNPTAVVAGVEPSDPGRLVVSVTRLGAVTGLGVASVEKTVITLPFMGVASGTTSFTFENDEVVDSTGTPIAGIQSSGPVDVTFP